MPFPKETKAQYHKTGPKSLIEVWCTPIVSSPGVLDSRPYVS